MEITYSKYRDYYLPDLAVHLNLFSFHFVRYITKSTFFCEQFY